MSNCKVIALTNQKGGVGKTTTAVNLGVSLVQQGKKVLLIDADAQANLTMALGYNRPDDIPITLSTVMQNIIDDKTLDVSQGIIHHSEGVDLLPSNIEMSGFEVRLINAMSRERVLKTYVNEVKKNYDYVLIDCMPSLGMITINALAAADSVIIPTQPHYLSAKANSRLTNLIAMRADGEISKDEYQAMRSPVDEEIKKLQKALDEIPQEKSNPKGLDIEGIRSTLNSFIDFSGSTISHDVVNQFVYLITPTSDTTFDWYVNLNGTADVKATFTAEGRKKNCIIKLEEIEKISSVHREKNEDNAHFIKNPHIFTYLHRLLSRMAGTKPQLLAVR